MAKLRVTQVKSGIGYAEYQKKTLKALGLGKMHKSVVHDDSSSMRGMIIKIRHLVEVEAID